MPAVQVLPAPDDLGSAAMNGGTSDNVVISAQSLGKKFKIYPKPWGRLIEWMTADRAKRHDDFWALRDVSFEVRRAESLGVIGVNGSGKSTLLKVISGAMYPTTGDFQARGRILSLLELGTGLNSELTGRLNVVSSARLLGFSDDFVRSRIADIEAFAELEDFFDRPVKLYSSGMLVRLAFSMFACFDPEIFVVDEALSVGDVFFQQKCVARIEQMLQRGTTMLFVSHDMQLVRRLCQRVLFLSHGRLEFAGPPDEAVARYYSQLGGARTPGAPRSAPVVPATAPSSSSAPDPGRADLVAHDVLPSARSRHGAGRLRLVAATFQNGAGDHALVMSQMDVATIRVLLKASEPIEKPSAGLHLFDRLGNLVFAAGTGSLGVAIPAMEAGEERFVTFRLTFSVQPGEYTLSLGCSRVPPPGPDVSETEDQCEGLGPVSVHPREGVRASFHGIARLPLEVIT